MSCKIDKRLLRIIKMKKELLIIFDGLKNDNLNLNKLYKATPKMFKQCTCNHKECKVTEITIFFNTMIISESIKKVLDEKEYKLYAKSLNNFTFNKVKELVKLK